MAMVIMIPVYREEKSNDVHMCKSHLYLSPPLMAEMQKKKFKRYTTIATMVIIPYVTSLIRDT